MPIGISELEQLARLRHSASKTRVNALMAQAVDLSPHAGRGERERGEREILYDSVRDVWLRTGLSPRVLERLADADAFASLGLNAGGGVAWP